jgi:hypothetical protein
MMLNFLLYSVGWLEMVKRILLPMHSERNAGISKKTYYIIALKDI